MECRASVGFRIILFKLLITFKQQCIYEKYSLSHICSYFEDEEDEVPQTPSRGVPLPDLSPLRIQYDPISESNGGVGTIVEFGGVPATR